MWLGLKLWFLGSVLVVGVAYYNRPVFPDTASNHGLKAVVGICITFVDLLANVASKTGYSPVNVTRWITDLITYVDMKEGTVKEYVTTMDGVEVTVFSPAGLSSGLRPGIIHLHGGGWVYLSPASYAPYIRAIVQETQSVIVSVNYRRAPEFLYPIPLEDCIKASKFFLRNAEKYDVDKNNIGIKGDSAGGNLAMAVSLHLTKKGETDVPPLKFMSLDYPPLQIFDMNLPCHKKYEKGPGHGNKNRMVKHWLMYSVGITDNFWDLHKNMYSNNHVAIDLKNSDLSEFVNKKVLPVEFQVTENEAGEPKENHEVSKQLMKFVIDPYFAPLMASDEDLKLLPPSYIMNVEFDVLRDDGFILVNRLRKVGVPVEHSYITTEEHGFLNLIRIDAHAKAEVRNFAKFFNTTIVQ